MEKDGSINKMLVPRRAQYLLVQICCPLQDFKCHFLSYPGELLTLSTSTLTMAKLIFDAIPLEAGQFLIYILLRMYYNNKIGIYFQCSI